MVFFALASWVLQGVTLAAHDRFFAVAIFLFWLGTVNWLVLEDANLRKVITDEILRDDLA